MLGEDTVFAGTKTPERIGGFVQVASDYMLITDDKYNCVKSLNRTSNVMEHVAGACTWSIQGYADGMKTDARFYMPKDIIVDRRDPLNVIILDFANEAIRQLDTRAGGKVTTIVKSYLLKTTLALCWPPESTEYLVVAARNRLYRVFTATEQIEPFYGETWGLDQRLENSAPHNLRAIVFVHQNIIIASTRTNNQLLIIDTHKQTELYICNGLEERREGHPGDCSITRPFSAAIINQTLYIGTQDGTIEKIPGIYLGLYTHIIY